MGDKFCWKVTKLLVCNTEKLLNGYFNLRLI